MWRHEEIDTLLSVLTVEKFMKSLQAPSFRSANWKNHDNKELWVADAVAKTGAREWFWIDDEVPAEERLQHLALILIGVSKSIQREPTNSKPSKTNCNRFSAVPPQPR